MANATTNLILETIAGAGPLTFDLPVDGGTHIYKGTLLAQLTATGQAVPYSTASSSHCVGIALHEVDNTGSDGDKRVQIQTKRMVALDNGAGGDAFSDTHIIGSLVYGSDDHTVADNSNSVARKPIGFFYGFEDDGKVRVFLDPALAHVVDMLQTLTDTPASVDALRDDIVGQFG